uniref:AlNc14C137G7125 protein n=1 Tax=Albugo laibachii Nc14 TaxID=890382 RepID=F0WKT6_9STRA|nr:AlNc14C137G7125 [Albugo laibachii Nc14]|eukprot:CCA21893.1 AlNc14C137G7125 [Albugo laibachii Nc14]
MSQTGRTVFALCGGLVGAYIGFYLQQKLLEEQRVSLIVEEEAQKRFKMAHETQTSKET